MIELFDVRKVYHGGRPWECVALDGVTLAIRDQEVTVLTGPSGSGKTTLLSVLGCMTRPTSGRVRMDGDDLSGLPERFLTEVRRQAFGFVFQQHNLIRGLTAVENVMLPAYPIGEPHRRLRERAVELLAALDLEGKASVRVEWLSGGEAQRVAIARALINNPSTIVADEPTAHLDTHLSRRFLDIVARFKREGRTVILGSHDPLVCGAAVVDRVVRLRDGRLEEGA